MIWATAAIIPPRDWPLTTAAMYSLEKRLAMPTRPPMKTAAAAENEKQSYVSINFIYVFTFMCVIISFFGVVRCQPNVRVFNPPVGL